MTRYRLGTLLAVSLVAAPISALAQAAEGPAASTLSALQRLETGASNHAVAQLRTLSVLKEARLGVEQAKDPDQTVDRERDVRMLESQLRQESSAAGATQNRRAEAQRTLDVERARYDELSDRFDRLERTLAPASR